MDLKKTVDNLYTKLERDEQIKSNEFLLLKDKYPKLYEKITSEPKNEENKRRVYSMLSFISKIQSGDISQHSASVEVGQELADKYLGHVLKKN